MKQIPLTRGKYAIVDDRNYQWLSKYKWQAIKQGGCFYAVRTIYRLNKTVFMHRQIMNYPKGLDCHHINHNCLDNRLCNLSNYTRRKHIQIHMQEQKSIKKTTSQYIGVSWRKGKIYKDKQYDGVWYAQICCHQKRIYIGTFDSEIEAAKAYDAKALELFGKFALINFPKKAKKNA